MQPIQFYLNLATISPVFLILMSPNFLIASMSTFMIAHIYLSTWLIRLDTRITSTSIIVSIIPSKSFFFDFFQNNYIFYCNFIGMWHVILLNLQLIFFFIFLIIEIFKKGLICHLVMDNIVVYCTTIIPNIRNKVVNYMKLWVVKSWSI